MRQESRPSDSVLFSLGELKTIEKERAERQREAQRQAEAALQAEERVREAAREQARRRADAQQRQEQADEERERARLEQEAAQAALKLKHAEEQARLQAELARQRQEVALRELERAARAPLWIGAGVIVLLVTLFVIWGVREHHRQQEEARQTAEAIAATKAETRRIKDSVAVLDTKLAAKRAAASPPSRAEPAPIVAKATGKKPTKGTKIKRPSRPTRPAVPLLNVDRCKGSPDPLCNLPRRKHRDR